MMPLFAVMGTYSETGEDLVEVLVAADAESATAKVQARGVFTSDTVLINEKRKRVTDGAVQEAACCLSELGKVEPAMILFRQLWGKIDDWHPFSRARAAVPHLVRAGHRDEAWGLIQHARVASWSREMYSVGAEKAWLLRLASDVLEADGRQQHSTVLRVAEMAGLVVSRDEIPDSQELSTRIALGLDETGLQFEFNPWDLADEIADAVLATLRTQGQVAAIWQLEERLVSACVV